MSAVKKSAKHSQKVNGHNLLLQGLTNVSAQIGSHQFASILFSFLNQHLQIDHFVVFTYSTQQGAGHLFTESIMPTDEAEGLARDYVGEFHMRDPLFAHADKTEMQNRTIHPSFKEEYDSEYRDHFFIQHDLVDKISITRQVDEGYIYCNFYRMGDSGKFSKEEKELFDELLPLISNLIVCHFRIVELKGPGEKNEEAPTARSLVHSVISRNVAPFDKLTERESEVCERILVGFTSTGISLDLNIAESSVNTYRRRAYEKLGIATQNELFSLCISALSAAKQWKS